MNVVKRDGRIVQFDKQKIVNAIMKAFESANKKMIDEDNNSISKSDIEYALIKANNIADYIYDYAKKVEDTEKRLLNIEEIQDMVEAGLQNTKRKDVARSYIIYRNDRTRERNKTKHKFDFGECVTYTDSNDLLLKKGYVYGIMYDKNLNKYFYILENICNKIFEENELIKFVK